MADGFEKTARRASRMLGFAAFAATAAGTKVASWAVELPPRAAQPLPVRFELDVKSVASMTWGAKMVVAQFDAAGRELPEYVTDGRWTTEMLPPQKAGGPFELVVTDGAKGGFYLKDGKILHYDGFKVNAVDTNGAGDTFHGAFLAEFVEGKSVEECCIFASAVSAYKCAHKGVRTLPFTRGEIDALLCKA